MATESQSETLEIQRKFLNRLVPDGEFDCCMGGLLSSHIDTAAILALYSGSSLKADTEVPDIYVAYKQRLDGPVIGGAFIVDPSAGPGRFMFRNEHQEWPEGREVKCPVELLAVLSPTEDRRALIWRAMAEKAATSVFGSHSDISGPAEN